MKAWNCGGDTSLAKRRHRRFGVRKPLVSLPFRSDPGKVPMFPMMDLDDDLFHQGKAMNDSLRSDCDLHDDASASATIAERTIKFKPKLHINKKINLPEPSKSNAFDGPSDTSKIDDVANEYSQLDAPLLHIESSDVHDLSFSADGLIESLEIRAHNCDNTNDLEPQSLLENGDLLEGEHTKYHIEELNFEGCAPSIVQNDKAGKSCSKVRQENKLKTSIDNIAGKAQNTKNSISEMDDGCYNGDDIPKQKKRKLPRKSCSISCENESSIKRSKKVSEEPASKESPKEKKRLVHGSSRSKRNKHGERDETKETTVNVNLLPDDRMQLVIRDLIKLADFKEQLEKKKAAAENSSTNRSEGDERDENGDDANAKTQRKSQSQILNYHSYLKRPVQTKWSKSDTEFFYQAIRQFGTDFEMIQVLFPDRSRRQVKAKFKNEQRKHPLQIADALVHRSEDHSHFEKVIQYLQALAEEKAKKKESNLSAQSPDEPDQNEKEQVEDDPNEVSDENCDEDSHTTTEFSDNENNFDQCHEDYTEDLDAD